MGTVEENLAFNLRRLRKSRGFTLIQLAKAAGVDKGTLNKWENKKQGFRLANLKSVATILGCTVEDLIADPDSEGGASQESLVISIIGALPTLNQNQLRSVALYINRLSTGMPLIDLKALGLDDTGK